MSVEFQEVDKSQITSNAVNAVGVVGPATKGPFGKALLLTNEADLIRYFGDSHSEDPIIEGVKRALNMGGVVRFSRSVHMTDVSNFDTRTSAPASVVLLGEATAAVAAKQTTSSTAFLNDGDLLKINLSGVVTDVEFQGVAAEVTSGAWNFQDLSQSKTLTVKVDRGPVQELNIIPGQFADAAQVDTAEIASVLNGLIKGASVSKSGNAIKITSDTGGSASYIQVTGGTLNALTSFAVEEVASAGPNNVPSLGAVTPADLKAVLDAEDVDGLVTSLADGVLTLQSSATGADVYLQFDASHGVEAKFGWTVGVDGRITGANAGGTQNALRVDVIEEGTWANGFSVSVVANALDATKRDLTIVSTNPYVPSKTFFDVDLANLPAHATWKLTALDADTLSVQSVVLAGGDNGIAGMIPATRIGTPLTGTGIYALSEVTDILDVMVPLLHDRAQEVILANWCALQGLHAHIMIPNLSVANAIDYVAGEGDYAANVRIDNSNASFRAGYAEFYDDLKRDGVTLKNLDASSSMIAVLGYNDTQQDSRGNTPGPHLSPSGEIRGKVGQSRVTRPTDLAVDFGRATSDQKAKMASLGINWLEMKNGEVLAKGNRTAQVAETSVSFLNVRRTLNFVRQGLAPILERVSDEPTLVTTWKRAHREQVAFLNTLADAGGTVPVGNDRGFVVNCDQNARTVSDAVLNTQERIDNAQFVTEVGLRIPKAYKDILVRITSHSSGTEFDVA